MNEILKMELSPNDEALLRESLTSWKEGVYADLIEEVEELKTQKIEELEEANREFQSELKEEYSQKLIVAIEEMRDQLKAEIISEMVENNPELKILESIKELIAPTLNEEYSQNMYAEEIRTLTEELNELRRERELDEGAQTLAELLAPYSKTTQNVILSVIQEGNSEEVTEQFYNILESLNEVEDEENEEEEDYEDNDENEDDDEENEDEENDEEEDDEDDEEDDVDESADPYINEDSDDEGIKSKKINKLLSEIKGLA